MASTESSSTTYNHSEVVDGVISSPTTQFSTTRLSESHYDSASEESFVVGNHHHEDMPSSLTTSVGDVGSANGQNRPPSPPPKPRMSFFSMKQFDPLLKTPVSVNIFSKSSKNDRAANVLEESPSTVSATSDTPIVRQEPTSNGTHSDQLIPITPMVSKVSINGTNTSIVSINGGSPSGPIVDHDPVVELRNGNPYPTESPKVNEEWRQKYVEVIDSLKSANELLLESFVDVVATKDAEIAELTAKVQQLSTEKEGLTEDLRGAEVSFNELHGRYERLKSSFMLSKESEERSVAQVEVLMSKVSSLEDDLLKEREQLAQVSESIESSKKESSQEVMAIRMAVKKSELKISALEGQLQQKTQENTQLQEMIDEMMANMRSK